MAPKRGWCKHCLDDYRHGDVIVKCSSCPRSFHRECLDNDLIAHSTHSAYYQLNGDNPLDLSDFTCDSCLQYAQEAEIVNDERCKICKERNRDETDVLLLCDGCPNSYHMSCLNLQIEPDSDKWYCPMCKPEAFEGVNVRAQRRNPLTDNADHVNSSICYVCQRHGKLLGCDFCSNSFHYDCLPEFDIDTIADVWECPCCRGEDPFLNQMHKRWTISQIEKNSRTRRKSIMTWRGVITRYRNRFILAHRNELSSFVASKIIEQLTKSFISNKNKNKKEKLKDVENQLELLQEEQLIESNKFIIKARKSCFYPSGRKKDNRPMRTGVSLKPHQEDGVDWLLKSFLTGGAILADEMGLGKTIQTLCFLSYLKMMNIEGPHLIVVPLSTVGNWLREIHRFTPHLTVIKICGSKTERQHAMSDRLAYSGLYDLFVTTYETVKCEEAFFVETVPRWQCLILDEAHRIKNQSGALRHSMDRIVSNMRLLLTGTPLQNNAQELFTLINFMFPDLFRDSQIMEQAFNAKKRLRNELEMSFTTEELDAIKLLLSKIMLRRLKEQAISLPKKVFHDVWLPLSQETLKWYRTLMNIKSLMNENMSIKKLLGIVIKMRIVCGHPRGIVSRSQQLDKLYAFFKQEDLKVQKKVQEEASELNNLKGLPHIYASAKLTFLDKLLCQLHYENCRLVPNYHKAYQQHLKSLDNSLYRKYTNALNTINKEESQEDNISTNDGLVDSVTKTPVRQSILDPFNSVPYMKNYVKSDQELMLKNLTEFTLQVKSEKLSLLHDEKAFTQSSKYDSLKKEMDNDHDDNENNNNKDNNNNTKQEKEEDDSEYTKVDLSSLKLKSYKDNVDNMDLDKDNKNKNVIKEDQERREENNEKENNTENKDNKDNKESQENKEEKEDKKKTKKKKLTKEEVLSKVENEFVRVPSSTSGSMLYLSSNLKEVNLTHNCPYVSMKLYENALEQEAKYKKDKKKSTYKFESTRLVEFAEKDQESMMNYVNNPNRRSSKIIESDDEFELDTSTGKETQDHNNDTQEDNKDKDNNNENKNNTENKEDTQMEEDKEKDTEENKQKEKTEEKKENEQELNETKENEKENQEKQEQNQLKEETKQEEKEEKKAKIEYQYDNTYDEEENQNKIRMHKVLVFTQFQLVLDELETYCVNRGWKYMRLDGSTNKLIRELDIREFNSSDSHYFVYLISTRAGGLGINLTAANHVVLYDEDWNPFIDLQAIDRAHRIGQKRDVHIWKLISEWTVEERMALIREKKLQLDKLILHTNNTSSNNTDNTDNNINNNNNNKETQESLEDTEKLLDDDDMIISLSHQAILKMMMHGNKALQHLECEQIIDKKLDEIVERKRKVPPQDLDDTNDIVDDILISKSTQVEGDDRVIIELVKEEDEMDIVQEETEKLKKKKVSGLLVKDLINEEDVVENKNPEDVEEYGDKNNYEMKEGMGEMDGMRYMDLLGVDQEAREQSEKHKNEYEGGDGVGEGFVGSQKSGYENENESNQGMSLDRTNNVDTYMHNETRDRPTRSRRSRLMLEMEQAGLLWRSVREKKKPNMIYTPMEWQKRSETKPLRHETKCFLCGKPKNFVAKYKDKDDNEVEVDYGELVKCFRCPKAYHKFCERLNVIKRNWCCRWHECCLCFRKSSQCGNLLIHCSNCPTSFCYDCFPPDYTRHYVNDDYYYNLTQRGLVANTNNWIFFLCSKCKIESERKKRSMSGEERDKHKKEQKELRSELLSSLKNKDESKEKEIKDKKKLKSLLNKQERARVDEMKAQEAELEERHRNLYQSLFPPNMIAELTDRVNTDILNSSASTAMGKPVKSQEKTIKEDKDEQENTEENTNNDENKEEKKKGRPSKTKQVKDEDDKEEKEDEDWGVGLRAKRRGLNFSNVKLPYKLLQFCDNCRIPLHNVFKNPIPCPFPKESVKLDLEITIKRPKPAATDGPSDQSSTKQSNDNEQTNNNKENKKEDENEKKIIKKGYCSSCYENRGTRSSHLRRHCEFLSEEERKEYKQRAELVEKAMKMIECSAPTSDNDIDYSQYNNIKLKALYNQMLDYCDSIYIKALVDVGLLSVPQEFLDNLVNRSNRHKNIKENQDTQDNAENKNNKNKQTRHDGVNESNPLMSHHRTKLSHFSEDDKPATPRIMSNTVIRNLSNPNSTEESYASSVDNKGLADYVRSFNSIYRHRSNRDTLLLPIVYEQPKKK